MTDATDRSSDHEIFAGKLFEWLAAFGVQDPGTKARQVAASFVNDGWTRSDSPELHLGVCGQCGHTVAVPQHKLHGAIQAHYRDYHYSTASTAAGGRADV